MSFLNASDINAIVLTLKLALVVTLILLALALPLARWLTLTRSRWHAPINALISLPLILPPTVLGFYLLLFLGANGPLGTFTQTMGWGLLPFSFWGLVIASCVYSLPFVVQPLQAAMSAVPSQASDAAATMGAGPIDRFFSVTLPLSRSGLLTAAVLGFAHTVGEFGVVLMIGGNIPNETRVVSVQIYDYVDMLHYSKAHSLSLIMLAFSFILLLTLYAFDRVSPSRLWSR